MSGIFQATRVAGEEFYRGYKDGKLVMTATVEGEPATIKVIWASPDLGKFERFKAYAAIHTWRLTGKVGYTGEVYP